MTDLEAHSWVEVYFNGIGWLPFDPTPPTTPGLASRSAAGAAFGIGASEFGGEGGKGGDRTRRERAAAPTRRPPPGAGEGARPSRRSGSSPRSRRAVLVVPPIRSLRHRRLPPAEAADREVAELRRVLSRTGWSRGSTTLLVVEGRLRGARHQAAADLRPPVPRPPLRDRRAARALARATAAACAATSPPAAASWRGCACWP